MPILTSEGRVAVEDPSWEEASVIGQYWNAVIEFRDTGSIAGLEWFEGVEIAGQPLLTDPDEVEFWAAQGELDFEDIYEAG